MPQFDRLGNDMSDDIADAEAEEQDRAEARSFGAPVVGSGIVDDMAADAEPVSVSLVEAVKNHAKANYNEGGWDMVVECYEDREIAEAIAGCTTEEEAIARLAEVAGCYHDRRLDAWHAGGLDDHGRLPEEKEEEVRHRCTCQDSEDCCDFCAYTGFMSDLVETGPVCADGGFRPASLCVDETWWGGRPQVCYMSQAEVPAEDEIPF